PFLLLVLDGFQAHALAPSFLAGLFAFALALLPGRLVLVADLGVFIEVAHAKLALRDVHAELLVVVQGVDGVRLSLVHPAAVVGGFVFGARLLGRAKPRHARAGHVAAGGQGRESDQQGKLAQNTPGTGLTRGHSGYARRGWPSTRFSRRILETEGPDPYIRRVTPVFTPESNGFHEQAVGFCRLRRRDPAGRMQRPARS